MERDLDQSGTFEGSELFFYLRDGQGNITGLTDCDGVILERYDYTPYGKVKILDKAGNLKYNPDTGEPMKISEYENPYLFQSRRLDPWSGHYYFRNRYYDPETGRFLSRDPARDDSLGNLYAFVNNNPVNAVDPWGLWERAHSAKEVVNKFISSNQYYPEKLDNLYSFLAMGGKIETDDVRGDHKMSGAGKNQTIYIEENASLYMAKIYLSLQLAEWKKKTEETKEGRKSLEDIKEYLFLVKDAMSKYGGIVKYTRKHISKQLEYLIGVTSKVSDRFKGKMVNSTIENIFKYTKDRRAPGKIFTFNDKQIKTVLDAFEKHGPSMSIRKRNLLLKRLTSSGVYSKAIGLARHAGQSIFEGGYKILSQAVEEGSRLNVFYRAALQAQVDPFSISPKNLRDIGYDMAANFYLDSGGINILFISEGASSYTIETYLKMFVNKVVEQHRKRLNILKAKNKSITE